MPSAPPATAPAKSKDSRKSSSTASPSSRIYRNPSTSLIANVGKPAPRKAWNSSAASALSDLRGSIGSMRRATSVRKQLAIDSRPTEVVRNARSVDEFLWSGAENVTFFKRAAKFFHVTVVFLLNVLNASIVSGIFSSPFTHFVRDSIHAAILRGQLSNALAAFGLGYFVYRTWRPAASKWVWFAGVCWLAQRAVRFWYEQKTISVVYVNQGPSIFW